MKALTVRQPWAHLIAAGIKRIENRTWPTAHRGPLAIHAARQPDAGAPAWMKQAGLTVPDDDAAGRGAIVAIVRVVDCVALEDLAPELAADPFAVGPWCWVFADAQAVTPIPWRGNVGLWNVPESIEITFAPASTKGGTP